MGYKIFSIPKNGNDAGWMKIPPSYKFEITMLKGTLSYNLKVALANNHNIPMDNFFGFSRIISQIALQHEELTWQGTNSAKTK